MYTYLNIHTEMKNKFFFTERNTGAEVSGLDNEL